MPLKLGISQQGEINLILELFLLVNGARLKIEMHLTTPRFGTNKPASTQIGTGPFTAYTMWGLGVKTIAAWVGKLAKTRARLVPPPRCSPTVTIVES